MFRPSHENVKSTKSTYKATIDYFFKKLCDNAKLFVFLQRIIRLFLCKYGIFAKLL